MRTTARACAVMALSIGLTSCALFRPSAVTPPPLPAPARAAPGAAKAPEAVVGVASWYGREFQGRPTASGDAYDRHDLTAASTVIPMGSRVRVTNLDNRQSVEVTINDHGPFVKGRSLDLSEQAAKIIGMTKNGTAKVRMEVLSKPAGSRDVGTALRYFVQVGSFESKDNAERVRKRAASHFPDVRMTTGEEGGRQLYRVRMGAFATRTEAERRAEAAERMGLPSVLVAE